MKASTSKMKQSTLFLGVVIVLLSVSDSQGTTLSPPHSPVKVLAEAGVLNPADKLRYYSFSDEDGRSNKDMDSAGSSNPYASKDPFEVPSLASIAEMMRRRDKYEDREEFRERDGPEHRSSDKDTGWGWPQYRSEERGREYKERDGGNEWESRQPPPLPPPTAATGGWAWSEREREPPPRPHRPQNRWEDDRERPHHGKGSYTPVDNKDVLRPWQIESGHSSSSGDRGDRGWSQVHTTTERPRYTPKYLASDEDKYRPIRYPSNGGGSASGWSDSGGANGRPPSSSSSVWPNKNQDSHPPHQWSGGGDREKFPEPESGPGPLYLPPHRDPPPREPPPLRDPPKWPTQSNDRDSDRDRDRDGWKSPPSSHSGRWEGISNNRPPPQQQHNHNPWNTRPSSGRDEQDSSKGWGKPEPPPRPPPTSSSGWGWESKREEPPRRPSPFEYKPGVDDLTRNIGPPIDIYERPDLPPGISRDRPYSHFESSGEEDSFPRAPNHYRIVAGTPSPAEIHKILYQKPAPGHKEEYPSSSHESSKDESTKCSGSSNRNCKEDKEKWFKENFQNDKTSDPEHSTPPRNHDSHKKPETIPLPNPTDSKFPSDEKGPLTKRTRYDAQGFKYIPYDEPVIRKVSPPRDIYSNQDQTRDSFKRAVQDKIKEREKARETSRLQGSESRNTFRRTLTSRSHISLWKSEELKDANNKAKIIASTTLRSTLAKTAPSTTTSTSTLRSKEEPQKENKEVGIHDYGRKIQIIRNRLNKKPEGGGFKPNSGAFGIRSRSKEREALVEQKNNDVIIKIADMSVTTTNSNSTEPFSSSSLLKVALLKKPSTTKNEKTLAPPVL